MSQLIVLCLVLLIVAVAVSRYDREGFYRAFFSACIVVIATFVLSFSFEQSARDAALNQARPDWIKTDFPAGIYAMKVAIGAERVALFLLILSVAVLAIARPRPRAPVDSSSADRGQAIGTAAAQNPDPGRDR